MILLNNIYLETNAQGLPHAHILLWLEERFKCTMPNEIHDIISAELPSPVEDLDEYKVVSEYMLHEPCGKDAKYAPCTIKGKCSKHYPKVFLAEKVIDEDGYPIYHHRDNKVTAIKGKFTYDNQYVVPYNRYFLLKYHAHINVEWCNRPKAIKYLFKYLNKGPNRATIVIQENAVWRLFSFDIHYSYPTVMQLNYHFPDQNAVTLRDSENLSALLEMEGINITMFTEWFELNKRDTDARAFMYAEIPQHYMWHAQHKLWKPRKQKKCIGMIVYSSPAFGERYYLRMLLNVVRGARSFEELMTVNKKIYATFKEACFAYWLLNDGKEWTHAIADAKFWAMRTQLYPGLQLTDEQIRNYCLLEIRKLLNRHRRSLAEFQDLPRPNPGLLTNLDNRLIREALDFDVNKSKVEHEQLHSLLNPEQRLIYDKVIKYVHSESGQLYFIYGPGGTGKTFVYRTIIARLRSAQKIVLVVASSGMSFYT
ncbi:ATP-dependent DNA helicase PIF1 [Tanacetum coccineum]